MRNETGQNSELPRTLPEGAQAIQPTEVAGRGRIGVFFRALESRVTETPIGKIGTVAGGLTIAAIGASFFTPEVAVVIIAGSGAGLLASAVVRQLKS